MKRILALASLALPLAACALPSPDQPAHYSQAGRFIGLVANCGCNTGLTESQVMAGFDQVVKGKYSEADLKAMRGYVEAGATEKYDNQMEICLATCANACMVNTVAEPLGGQTIAGAGSCPITARDLTLTTGIYSGNRWP